MYARSLPQETSTRIFWQGNGMVDFADSNAYNNNAPSASAFDQVFNLSKLGGPLALHHNASAEPNNMQRFIGKFSYQDQWALLYKEALVTGALLKLVIKRPVYPTKIVPVLSPEHPATGVNSRNRVPGDAAQGYWYIRYRYTRSSDENPQPGDVVGHPILDSTGTPLSDATFWPTMRDFLHDPTVTWIKDDIPKISALEFTLKAGPRSVDGYPGTSANNVLIDATYNPNMMGSSASNIHEDFEGQDIRYHQQFSNRSVKLIGAYSRRRHLVDKNYLRNSEWQNLRDLKPVRVTTASQNDHSNFFVKIGYICWNSQGTVAYSIPMDRIAQRNITATLMYKVRLRMPLVEPFDHTLPTLPPTEPNDPGEFDPYARAAIGPEDMAALDEYSQDDLEGEDL